MKQMPSPAPTGEQKRMTNIDAQQHRVPNPPGGVIAQAPCLWCHTNPSLDGHWLCRACFIPFSLYIGPVYLGMGIRKYARQAPLATVLPRGDVAAFVREMVAMRDAAVAASGVTGE